MKLLSILIIALASSYSFAAHHEGHSMKHSEALTQAAAGMNRVNLGYNYSSSNIQLKDDPLNISEQQTINTNRVLLNYERGFNDMFAAGLGVDYVSVSSGNGFDASGVEHVSLFFKGNYNMGSGGLYYGVNVDVGLGDNETDTDGSNNASLGGTNITPYLAWSMNHGSFAWGLRADYTVRGKQKFNNETLAPANQESESEDGNVLKISAFYEKNLSDKSIFGVGINHIITDSTVDAETDLETVGDFNETSIDLYGVVSCGACDKGGMYFVPKVSYTLMGDGESEDGSEYVTSGGNYAIEFLVRKDF